jgi:hypothetical protein
VIYFVQAEIIGRIKIGYCARGHFEKRLSHLQIGSPVELRVLATCRGDRTREAILHDRFAASRVRGEWFEPTPDLVRFIARLNGRALAGPRPGTRPPSRLMALILEFLRREPGRAFLPSEVAAFLQLNPGSVRTTLMRLLLAGSVQKSDGVVGRYSSAKEEAS